jgi:hypothetical protein
MNFGGFYHDGTNVGVGSPKAKFQVVIHSGLH